MVRMVTLFTIGFPVILLPQLDGFHCQFSAPGTLSALGQFCTSATVLDGNMNVWRMAMGNT